MTANIVLVLTPSSSEREDRAAGIDFQKIVARDRTLLARLGAGARTQPPHLPDAVLARTPMLHALIGTPRRPTKPDTVSRQTGETAFGFIPFAFRPNCRFAVGAKTFVRATNEVLSIRGRFYY